MRHLLALFAIIVIASVASTSNAWEPKQKYCSLVCYTVGKTTVCYENCL